MGMRARWLWRHSEGSREGPMSSNPARPTGESNPVAWPPPEARHWPWFTAECMHGVRGDSAHKNSKDAAAAGFERQLAHQFCGAAWSTHQCDSFEPTLKLMAPKARATILKIECIACTYE